jgi:CspA family cold shock protein
MAHGTVKFFDQENGHGAITSGELPAGEAAFVHYSAIEGGGYRDLDEGENVEFDFEARPAEGYNYVATHVRKV